MAGSAGARVGRSEREAKGREAKSSEGDSSSEGNSSSVSLGSSFILDRAIA